MGFTENVVEFMAQDLDTLPESTCKLLQSAALFGNKFDIRDVAHVGSIALEQAEGDLWKALHEGKSYIGD